MPPIFTIGHSTRSIDEFIELLKLHRITQLVDIRTIPKSRHNPQFGQNELKGNLQAADIEYVYIEELGGLRSPTRDSINGAWRNASFRNYADYMQTAAFVEGVEKLIRLSRSHVTAIMCAEAVPWRCHRSLVSDALLVRSVTAYEIISKAAPREHILTSFAVVDGTVITYPETSVENK